MDYSPLANLIINNLYSQMQNFMPQYYGGYVEKEELCSTTSILAYDRNDMLIFGYEFHTDQTGNISAVSCFGQKAKDEYPAMKASGKIFGLPISKFDLSDFPKIVKVYIG